MRGRRSVGLEDGMVEAGSGPVVAIVTGMEEYQRRVLSAAQATLVRHRIPIVAHIDGPYARGAGSPLLVSLLTRGDARGVITMNQQEATDQQGVLALLAGLDLPTVHVGIEVAGAAAVRGDNESGMRALMAHLLEARDVRAPVLIRGPGHQPDSVRRERVVRDELARHGVPLDPEAVLDGEFLPEATYPLVRRLLRARRDVDAVVALNDRMATAALAALTDAGLRVPEDVAVTGFDDDRAATHWPGLTTVDQGFEQQGEAAAQLLLEQLDGAPPRHLLQPTTLVVRGSTGSPDHPPVTEPSTAVEMARHSQALLQAEQGVLAMSQALDYCWTIQETADALSQHLERLGIPRLYLALYERSEEADEERETFTVRVDIERAHLVLDYRLGLAHAPPRTSFPSHQLLPEELAEDLRRGPLVLQPLAVLDRAIGYLLYELTGGSEHLAERLRIDLGRAIDGVLATQEAQAHAAMLERTVARRTAELRAQVATRRRAETELQRANTELRRSAMIDGLTRIANRTAFEQALREHWDQLAGGDRALALLMIDVDAFKPYNDHYGHVLGDEALRTVAARLARSVRDEQDLACRYGGEEFAVVLPGSTVQGALTVAHRFRDLLAEVAIPHETSPVAPILTVSIGVAAAVPQRDGDPEEVVNAADRAMYRAKARGRDRVVVDRG